MAAPYKEGDYVQITARDATAADVKSGLYYPHFANLRGTILKVYGQEASVLVDRDTLPDAVRDRHEESERAERKRYLDRLSEDAKGKLGQKEKEFSLSYAVLVSVNDLQKAKAPKPAAPAAATGEEAKRLTEAELNAREEAELAKRRRNGA